MSTRQKTFEYIRIFSKTQSKIDSLQELNSQLIATIAELRKENADVKAENTKLKQDKEEIEARFAKLEQKDKEKSILITKLQHDVSLIKEQSIQDKNTECHQTVTDTQNALSTKDVSQYSVNSNDTPDQTVSQCEDTPISDNTSNSDVSDNASNSDISQQVENSSNICQEKDSRYSESPISPETNSNDTHEQKVSQSEDALASDNVSNSDVYQESLHIRTQPKLLEDEEMDDFLDLTYKEKVGKEIIRSIRKKKL